MMTTVLNFLEMLGIWSFPNLWLPLAAWTLVVGPLYLLLSRWHNAHPLVQQHARQALLLALPLGLAATAALALFPEPQAGSALLPTLVVFPALPAPAIVAIEAAPTLDFGLMHVAGLATLFAGLLALGRGVQLAAHAAALRRFRRTLSTSADPGLQRRARRLSRHAGIGLRRRVRVVCTKQPVTPMTFGFARPVIVLPEALAADDERLRMTLAHEGVHIRRGDYLAQAVEQGITALFAVHPLVHALRRSIAAWRERACDAAVLEDAHFGPHRYAALLRDLALAAPTRQAATVALTERPDHLKARIEAMKDYPNRVRRFLSPKRTGLLLGAVLLVVAAGIVACTEMVDANETPTAAAPTLQATGNPEVFMVVEDMPNIKGGMEALYEQIEYPEEAREAGIEGKVFVQFTVDEEGYVVDPVIMKSPDELLSKAALDAVKKITFEPGKQRGQAVKVRLSLPIRFELADGETTDAINLRLKEDGTLYLNDHPVALDALSSRLRGLISDPEGAIVSVRVARGAPMGMVTEVQERVREAGALKINYHAYDETHRLTLPSTTVVGYPGVNEGDGASSPTALGLLEGQIDVGQLGIEGREMAIRDLEFSGNTVTGRIVDATTGQPRPGANVVVQGRNIGAATDADGWFTIHADAPIEGITASFVGYETVQVQQ